MPKHPIHFSPAEWVIATLNGVNATARALKIKPSTVSKWRNSKRLRGTGGLIPSKRHRMILAIAKKHDLDITPMDLVLGRTCKR